MNRRLRPLLAIGASLALVPLSAFAQAFTAPAGIGQITLAWQYVDNTGHRFSDGFLVKRGESVTMSALVEVDYAITDRLAVTGGIPYVFAKYTGDLPSFSGLPHDQCRCWHSTFQDLSVSARYRFGNDPWAITPQVRYVVPSHDYGFRGEAVAGRRLQETQIGLNAARKLSGALEKVTVQGGYTYAFVEKPLPDLSIDRSNAFVDLGYALSDRFFIRGTAEWQTTHGGVRVGSPTGNPFFPPGELNTPARFAQRDRIQRSEYWHATAGLSYALGATDVFAAYTRYLDGKDTHAGQAFTVGVTWYFDRSRL